MCVCVTVCWGCGGWIKCVYLYTCVLLRMLEMPWYPRGSQNKCSCPTFNNPTHTRTYTYIHTHTNSSLYQYFVLSQNIRANLIIHSRQKTDSHWEHTNRGTSLCEETMCVVALTGMACPCFVMNSERRSGTVKKYLKNTLSTSSGVSEISKHCHHKYSSHTANTDHTQAAAT